MKKLSFLLLLFGCFLFNSTAHAQQLFRAGIVGGFNFTQIDGDDVAGYDKLGLNGGFVVELGLDEYNRWSAAMEILYSQKGSRSTLRNSVVDFKITMDYAEIPLLVKYHDLKGGLIFGAGVLIGRSVKNKYEIFGLDETEDYFGGDYPPKKWDVGGIVDVSYMFSSTFGLNFRFTNSITATRTNCDSILAPSNECLRQRHRALALRAIFMFAGQE
ncbi:MAG: porin family protein [Chitinophagales bacterium]